MYIIVGVKCERKILFETLVGRTYTYVCVCILFETLVGRTYTYVCVCVCVSYLKH